jgi:hypothetical protein
MPPSAGFGRALADLRTDRALGNRLPDRDFRSLSVVGALKDD